VVGSKGCWATLVRWFVYVKQSEHPASGQTQTVDATLRELEHEDFA